MREFSIYALLLLLLASLAGFAWLTNHPETPWVEEAEQWPIVGRLAARFREAYVPPAPLPQPENEAEGELQEPLRIFIENQVGPRRERQGQKTPISTDQRKVKADSKKLPPSHPTQEEHQVQNLGTSPRIIATQETMAAPTGQRRSLNLPPPKRTQNYDPSQVQRFQWFLPGTGLRLQADSTSQAFAKLSSTSYLPILETRGEWKKVVYQGKESWTGLRDRPTLQTKGTKAKRLLRVEPNDTSRLRRARKLMGIDGPTGHLGPYRLFTDFNEPAFLSLIDSLADQAETAYLARYGRQPSGKVKRAIVLFSREADYREYSGKVQGLDNRSHIGHAGRGVIALYAEGRHERGLARTVLHEITHLLNDRAIGPRLPPWLEEGLASDLGTIWVETVSHKPDGPFYSLPGLVITGEDSSFLLLNEARESKQLPSVLQITSLRPEVFYRPEIAHLTYAQSTMLIRFLLDGNNGRHADGFRAFLKAVSYGKAPSPAELTKHLGADLETLDKDFKSWIELRAAEAALRRP